MLGEKEFQFMLRSHLPFSFVIWQILIFTWRIVIFPYKCTFSTRINCVSLSFPFLSIILCRFKGRYLFYGYEFEYSKYGHKNMSNHFRFGKHKMLFTATPLLLSDVFLREHGERIDCFFLFFSFSFSFSYFHFLCSFTIFLFS